MNEIKKNMEISYSSYEWKIKKNHQQQQKINVKICILKIIYDDFYSQ